MHLRRSNPWIIVSLAALIIALVACSWAVIAQRSVERIEEPEMPALHLEDLRLEEPLDLKAFWREHGFIPRTQNSETILQRDWAAQQWVHWTQRRTHWQLVPGRPDTNFQDALGRLVTRLTSAGLVIRLEQDPEWVSLSIFETIPMVQQRMELEVWMFQKQTPQVFPKDYDGPKLAVIIDDWGYRSSAMDLFAKFPYPLTFAVLPQLPESKNSVILGQQAFHELILHQPMEALNADADPGPGAIYVGMSREEVWAELERNLADLGQVVGVNNHMGSRVTADPVTMGYVMEYMQQRSLFFVDSMTTHESVVVDTARQAGIPFSVNRTFLDNVNEMEPIKEQIREALSRAQASGSSVAIGHVRPRTAEALWSMIPEIMDSGVQLVPVSETLTQPDS